MPEAVWKDNVRQSLSNLLSLHGLKHGEHSGYFILRATGLLLLVGVVTFHTASPLSCPSQTDTEKQMLGMLACAWTVRAETGLRAERVPFQTRETASSIPRGSSPAQQLAVCRWTRTEVLLIICTVGQPSFSVMSS
jgi:hypothetical protein